MQEDQRDVREKCERFRQSIMQRANAQIAEIDRKLKEYRVSELGKYEDDARGDSAHRLEEESRRIETAAAHAVSERRAELRRQLYERRIQLTDEVFQKAEESLSEFVSGQEYSEFLRQKAEKAGKLRKDGEPVLLQVRPADLHQSGELLLACGMPARVEEDETIRLGGLRFVLELTGWKADETLDAALEAQRQWFYENAGLFLSQEQRGEQI